MVHKQTGNLLNTNSEPQVSTWIFVISASKELYAGEEGPFWRLEDLRQKMESSSLSAYSGHYRPSVQPLRTLETSWPSSMLIKFRYFLLLKIMSVVLSANQIKYEEILNHPNFKLPV
ncbi:hypothetical protein Ddye_029024 [Dipteronia dyeriana]|uniref:Uncharacterized protein n=1 Tax=Dipteronia dyeriana TaxID=168575 RepID=A0AAD9WL45_9ROSI|nr:hypothetical protein Ddye_029024 [Dipteronia dyeriana]